MPLHTVHQHIHSNVLEILKKHRYMSKENYLNNFIIRQTDISEEDAGH